MPLALSSRVDDVTDVVDGSVGKRGGREELQRGVFVRLPVDWVDACDVDLEEQADPVAAGRWHAFDGMEKADVARCNTDAGFLGQLSDGSLGVGLAGLHLPARRPPLIVLVAGSRPKEEQDVIPAPRDHVHIPYGRRRGNVGPTLSERS